MGFQADLREAAVGLLEDYAATASIKLQVYPGRPRSIVPPTAFIDTIGEQIAYQGISLRQRSPRAEIIVIHGLFDSAEATAQKDDFVDGFLDWVTGAPHEVGANTLIAVTATEDIPNYVPDWLPPEQQKVYFATQITLEGYVEN